MTISKSYCEQAVFSFLGAENQLLIAPGDVIDKYTITALKLQHITDTKKKKFLHDELRRTFLLLSRIFQLYTDEIVNRALDLLKQLMVINTEQWSWEDKVRSEKSWEAAVGARDCNTRRVDKKNEINSLLGYPIEQKEYKK